jgi:hypothetical protein
MYHAAWRALGDMAVQALESCRLDRKRQDPLGELGRSCEGGKTHDLGVEDRWCILTGGRGSAECSGHDDASRVRLDTDGGQESLGSGLKGRLGQGKRSDKSGIDVIGTVSGFRVL